MKQLYIIMILVLCANIIFAQDWVKGADSSVEYNCDVVGQILWEYSGQNLEKYGDDVFRVSRVFSQRVPACNPKTNLTHDVSFNVIVKPAGATLSDCAETTCEIISRVPDSAVLEVVRRIEFPDSWYEVIYEDGTAFVQTSSTEFVEDWAVDISDDGTEYNCGVLTPALAQYGDLAFIRLGAFINTFSESFGENVPDCVPASNAESEVGIVHSTQNVNVRSGNSLNASIIDVLRPGSKVTILGENDTGDWFNVITPDGDEGWIASFLIRVEASSEPEPTETPQPTDIPALTCKPLMRLLGNPYYLVNSYEGSNYSSYTYELADRIHFGDYELYVEVGNEWKDVVQINSNIPGYARETIDGVQVSYVYEGISGSDEGIFFNFEYGELKYGGDVSIYGANASPAFRLRLYDDMVRFIARITLC